LNLDFIIKYFGDQSVSLSHTLDRNEKWSTI